MTTAIFAMKRHFDSEHLQSEDMQGISPGTWTESSRGPSVPREHFLDQDVCPKKRFFLANIISHYSSRRSTIFWLFLGMISPPPAEQDQAYTTPLYCNLHTGTSLHCLFRWSCKCLTDPFRRTSMVHVANFRHWQK